MSNALISPRPAEGSDSKSAIAPGQVSPLPEIERQLGLIDARVAELNRQYNNELVYFIVAKGLMFLKAKASLEPPYETVSHGENPTRNALSLGKTPCETVSHGLRRNGKAGRFEGSFLKWLAEKWPDTAPRTAQNCMNAARNAGLTSDHSLEDVEALRAAEVLHGKTASELYRLADALKDKPTHAPSLPLPNLVAAVQLDLFRDLDQILAVRGDMEPDDFEATTQRILATLVAFTGHAWEPAGSGIDDAAQHAEMSEIKSKKRGGKGK